MAVLKEKGKAAKFCFVALGRKLERGATACIPKTHGICGEQKGCPEGKNG